jgi:hypothetical protein
MAFEETLRAPELPLIRRARLWRLYSEDGKRRFLDLWQDGGRLILGARPSGFNVRVKDLLERGLAGPYPSGMTRRLVAALARYFPGRARASLFANEAEARAALERSSQAFAEWRPFGADFLRLDPSDSERIQGPKLGNPQAARAFASPVCETLLLVLPVPRLLSPGIVLTKAELSLGAPISCTLTRQALSESGSSLIARNLFTGAYPLPAPISLAAAVASFHSLERQASQMKDEDLKLADKLLSTNFELRGPWLFPRKSKSDYEGFAKACLEKGIILSPEYELASLLPGEFTQGELAPILKL